MRDERTLEFTTRRTRGSTLKHLSLAAKSISQLRFAETIVRRWLLDEGKRTDGAP